MAALRSGTILHVSIAVFSYFMYNAHCRTQITDRQGISTDIRPIRGHQCPINDNDGSPHERWYALLPGISHDGIGRAGKRRG